MKQKFQQFIRSNRWLKCVPNFLTVCNALCGFTAILVALYYYQQKIQFGEHHLEAVAIGACIILFAMIFDALDGAAARIFNAASMHGIQMDSLADMTTFGTAPAVLCAIMAHHYLPVYVDNIQQYQYVGIWFFCGVYLACAALRLATYNVHAFQQKKSGDKFSGLPSPAAASAVCSVIIFYAWCVANSYDTCAKIVVQVLPFYAALMGLLMVSSFQYVHAFKKITQIRKKPGQILGVVSIVVLVCIWPAWTLLAVVNLYLISAPAEWLLRQCGLRRSAPLLPKEPSEPPPVMIDGIS